MISLSQDLPSHCDQLIRILDNLLVRYKETCLDIYKGIVQTDGEDKGVISATWVRDADIERLLKSLPNWTKLQKRKDKKVIESFDESPEELHAQNIRESGTYESTAMIAHKMYT